MPGTVSAVSAQEQNRVEELLLQPYCIHEHLDWSETKDLFSANNFCYAVKNGQRYESLLSISKKAADVFWIQFFYSTQSSDRNLLSDWLKLFSAADDALNLKKSLVAAIPMNNTFEYLIRNSGFQLFEEILFLEAHCQDSLTIQKLAESYTVRPFLPADISRVAVLCEETFPPLWRLSRENIRRAAEQSDTTLVIETEERICGYLLAEHQNDRAHLSRIAVVPEFQFQGLGTFLLRSMMNHYLEMEISNFTVNTQSTNQSAIALYRKNGFYLSKDAFPVYAYGISPFMLKKRQQPNN